MHNPVSVTSPGRSAEVSVITRGDACPVYHRGDGRPFVPGVPGCAYTLRVRNLLPVRVEVIASVDGRHVLDDEPASPHACHGLVIGHGQEYEFRGWRVSDDETREFLFADPGASVAAQATGSTANTGVIGFAIWREAGPLAYRSNWQHPWGSGDPVPFLRGGQPGGQSVSPVAAASAGMPESYGTERGSLGTGIGARQDDRVGRTSFSRAPGPPDTLVIGYDTEGGLIRRGITGPADPDPFPGSPTGYAGYQAP